MTMDPFPYRAGELHCEHVPLTRVANEVGTPCYVYSRAAIVNAWQAYDTAFGDYPHLVCYAVKANGNLAILNVLAGLGSGFDIVSGGELERVVRAGGDPARIVYSGVAKRRDEIARALELGIRCIDVESASELERVSAVAVQTGITAPVALRVNPDIDARTHPYIATGLGESKFGVAIADAMPLYKHASRLPGLDVVGAAMHIGSQIIDVQPLVDSLERLLDLNDQLEAAGIHLRHLDIGGGLGIAYRDEVPPPPSEYVGRLLEVLARRKIRLPVTVEPGRSIVGAAGVLLTRVEHLKENGDHRFAIVDAGMNDLLRPALYGAWHGIDPVAAPDSNVPGKTYDVVGPVCESGDVLGTQRDLVLTEGTLLAVRTAGAYGAAMSSNYNARPRAAEVMVDGDQFHVVRRREKNEDMMALESVLPT